MGKSAISKTMFKSYMLTSPDGMYDQVCILMKADEGLYSLSKAMLVIR